MRSISIYLYSPSIHTHTAKTRSTDIQLYKPYIRTHGSNMRSKKHGVYRCLECMREEWYKRLACVERDWIRRRMYIHGTYARDTCTLTTCYVWMSRMGYIYGIQTCMACAHVHRCMVHIHTMNTYLASTLTINTYLAWTRAHVAHAYHEHLPIINTYITCIHHTYKYTCSRHACKAWFLARTLT